MEGIRKTFDSFSNLVNCLTNSTFSICVSKFKTSYLIIDKATNFECFLKKVLFEKVKYFFFKIAWKTTWLHYFGDFFGAKYWASLDWIHLVGFINKVGNTAIVNFFHFRNRMYLNFLFQRPKTCSAMYTTKFEIGTSPISTTFWFVKRFWSK